MIGTQNLIKDFYGNNFKMFYTANSGALMVEVIEMRRLQTYNALELAKRIMAYKRRLAKGLPC